MVTNVDARFVSFFHVTTFCNTKFVVWTQSRVLWWLFFFFFRKLQIFQFFSWLWILFFTWFHSSSRWLPRKTYFFLKKTPNLLFFSTKTFKNLLELWPQQWNYREIVDEWAYANTADAFFVLKYSFERKKKKPKQLQIYKKNNNFISYPWIEINTVKFIRNVSARFIINVFAPFDVFSQCKRRHVTYDWWFFKKWQIYRFNSIKRIWMRNIELKVPHWGPVNGG